MSQQIAIALNTITLCLMVFASFRYEKRINKLEKRIKDLEAKNA